MFKKIAFTLVLGASLISCSRQNHSSTAFRDKMYQNQDFLTSSYSGTTLSESNNSESVIVSELPSNAILPAAQHVTEKQISNSVNVKHGKISTVEKILLQKAEKQLIKKNNPAEQKKSEGKTQLVALMLVLFVGTLGIHRFYLGYTAIGIAQLLTFGGCGIWSLIDLIRICTGDLKPKDGEYSETF